MENFKMLSDVWTLVYKEVNGMPIAFSYSSEKDAKAAKLMVEDNDGCELIDEEGNAVGRIELEWCYLINGKLIDKS